MMREAIFVGLVALVAVAIPVRADVGDLTPVACPPGSALQGQSLYTQQRGFGKPSEGSGTVNQHAVVATLKSGSMAIKVAIDSAKADAKAADVVRFDFSGKGRFDNKHVLPLRVHGRSGAPSFNASFGPATWKVEHRGKAVPVIVQGNYSRSRSYRYVNIRLGTGVQGRCAFGKKVYSVRVVDGNNNLRIGDALSVVRRGGKLILDRRRGTLADTMIVDTGDGTFSKSARKHFCGQPALVDGVWYKVKISEDGSKISAKPIDVKTGRIKIPYKNWSGMLIGNRHVLNLSGSEQPIAVPADQYRIADYRIMLARATARGPGAMLMAGRGNLYSGDGKTFDVPAGKTTSLAIGPPLTASVQASQGSEGGPFGKRRVMRLSLKLVDAAGSSIDYLHVPGSKSSRPPAPKVKIFDRQGKNVYSCTMEYG